MCIRDRWYEGRFLAETCLEASAARLPAREGPARTRMHLEHPAAHPKRRRSPPVMKALFGRLPLGAGGGRSATASAGSTTAPGCPSA
eukprot:1007858-Alexandrium_andersonii.AAC.1